MAAPRIVVHDLGGAGPTVLYAHATGFHAHCWTAVTRHLPDLHHIAYDARGHGDTPVGADWVDGPVDWDAYGADAADVAESVHSDRPLLGVGHSMGGAALLMASLAVPQRFRGLVVYEPIAMPAETLAPGAVPPGAQPSPLVVGARKRRSTFASFQDAIRNYTTKPPMNVFTPDAMEAYVHDGFTEDADGQVHLKCAPEHEARTYEAAGDHDTWERLGDVIVPVWVVSGAPQPLEPSERARELADRIPGSRYIQLDHLGHFGPMQAPHEIAEIIAAATSKF